MQYLMEPARYESRISRRMHMLASVPVAGIPFLAYNSYRNRYRDAVERRWLDNPNLEFPPHNPDKLKIGHEKINQTFGSAALAVTLFGIAYGLSHF